MELPNQPVAASERRRDPFVLAAPMGATIAATLVGYVGVAHLGLPALISSPPIAVMIVLSWRRALPGRAAGPQVRWLQRSTAGVAVIASYFAGQFLAYWQSKVEVTRGLEEVADLFWQVHLARVADPAHLVVLALAAGIAASLAVRSIYLLPDQIDLARVPRFTEDRYRMEIEQGGRFVIFPWVVSVIAATFHRTSRVYFVPAGRRAPGAVLRYASISLVFGWWGVPWGVVKTLEALDVNLSGGADVTSRAMTELFPPRLFDDQ